MHQFLTLLATVLIAAPCLAAPADPPNIVFILVDDQGWNDIGYHNPEMRTPHLDKLAKEGIELDAHYVQPECTPSRVAMMTGRYPSRFGAHCITASNEQALPFGTQTIASMLKARGYATALCGKWHLGSKPEWGPNHFGFDHSYGSLAGAVGMYDHRYRERSPFAQTWHRNGEFIEEEGHAIDLVAREAVRWIEQPRDVPFFLYVPFHGVHTPIVPKEEWLAANAHIEDQERRMYAAAVSHLDDGVGQIVSALERSGLRNNTLIIYSSDNGAQVNHAGNAYPAPDPALSDFSSNLPLRGKKTQTYEGGIRVPAFVNWRGRLAPRKLSAPMHMVDWLPTIAALTQSDADGTSLDGMNHWSLLSGENESVPERSIYVVWGANRQWEALRHGDWKIVRSRGKQGEETPWQLFNLADDPHETADQTASQPDMREKLVGLYLAEKQKDAVLTPGKPSF